MGESSILSRVCRLALVVSSASVIAANLWMAISADNTTQTTKRDGMADIGNRLIQLRARRVGDDRPQRTTLSSAQALDLMAKTQYPSGEKG